MGHLFFGWNPVALEFTLGAQYYFSTSFLKGIIDAVSNALVIQQAMFPCEWLSLAVPEVTYGAPRTLALPGLPPTRWSAPAPAPIPPAPGQAKKEDTLHPKICALMDPYLQWYNNVLNLSEILTLSGKRMMDLPSLPQYCLPTGNPFICWNSVLANVTGSPSVGLPKAMCRKGRQWTHLPGQSLKSSKKGWSITPISRQEVAPPAANAKPGVGAKTPDFRWGRVLMDAHRRQSTTRAHWV
jgi:hypothetical protein